MKSTQTFSPEKERKIACLVSVAFMILAWGVFAGLLVLFFKSGHPEVWGGFECCMVFLCFLPLLLIPFQLARYFRQMRTGNIGTIGVFNSRALSSCQSQSIKWWNYVFAFVVVFFYSCLFRVF